MTDVKIPSKDQSIARLSGPQEGKKLGLQGPETMIAEREAVRPSGQITLRQAWARYHSAHLVRKGRSERTIESYRDHVERLLAEWLDLPLQELGMDPARVVIRHDDITEENGPYIANGSMRTLRAIYRHARRTHRSLPADNPVDAVDWNAEKRRKTGMGIGDLKGWFAELAALDNPIRREFHLFTLLSGSRPAALQVSKPGHIDFRRRTLYIEKPKGGVERAFDIPLSREMVLCLVRAMRFGRKMYPSRAAEWIFPADSASGHLAEHKEDRTVLSKWGNDLRQSFRTIATAAGVADPVAMLLMNHAVPGVDGGYVNRHKLVEDYLRSQQQRITSTILQTLGDARAENPRILEWIGRGTARQTLLNAMDDENHSHHVGIPVTLLNQYEMASIFGFGSHLKIRTEGQQFYGRSRRSR
jgi:site-specific recombinase XerD